MNLHTAPLKLQCGATINVHAWPYRVFTARYADYRRVLDLLCEPTFQASTQGLLDRVLEASVPAPEDRALIATPDLEGLLDTIQALNRLVEVASKPLRLRRHLTRAEQPQQVPMTPSPT
ncbi:hypothetical protein [Deinococcus rufus]|uniref:Uncharacterized protein n=1 Tax=Deinococcus rufus TaxID=2136097 RepID=A0ABV7Z805_9DEIO